MSKGKKMVVSDKSMEEAFSEMQLRMMQDLPEKEQQSVSEIVWGTRKQVWKTIPLHAARIAVQKYTTEEAEERCVEVKSKLKAKEELVREKEAEVFAAEEELARAKERVEAAKKSLSMEKRQQEWLHKQLEKEEKSYQHQKGNLEQMKEIALVHSTASLKQIYHHQLAEILVTNSEADILERLLPDRIFDTGENVNFIMFLPRDFEKKYDETTRRAMIEYCNMVINMTLAVDEVDLKVVTLFSNSDISEILRLNGFDFDN